MRAHVRRLVVTIRLDGDLRARFTGGRFHFNGFDAFLGRCDEIVQIGDLQGSTEAGHCCGFLFNSLIILNRIVKILFRIQNMHKIIICNNFHLLIELS